MALSQILSELLLSSPKIEVNDPKRLFEACFFFAKRTRDWYPTVQIRVAGGKIRIDFLKQRQHYCLRFAARKERSFRKNSFSPSRHPFSAAALKHVGYAAVLRF